jgi:hypothetical protein
MTIEPVDKTMHFNLLDGEVLTLPAGMSSSKSMIVATIFTESVDYAKEIRISSDPFSPEYGQVIYNSTGISGVWDHWAGTFTVGATDVSTVVAPGSGGNLSVGGNTVVSGTLSVGEIADVEAAINANSASAETTARIAADSTLMANINAEYVSRANADTAEAAARAAAGTAIRSEFASAKAPLPWSPG